MTASLPASVDDTLGLLAQGEYVADTSLATALYLALRLGRPLFLEGEAGVGKTEIAKVLSATLGRRLIRLQCYEGLDVSSAVYEWNYARQMLEIRIAEAAGGPDRRALPTDLFGSDFLIRRPLLQALEPDPAGAPVLLIDELDRTDEPFEAFLLEVLSDFQVTIPELGPMKAATPPVFWALATTVSASVVLPEDSGPKISMMRPRGRPRPPSARSRLSAPVAIEGIGSSESPSSFMIEPLP